MVVFQLTYIRGYDKDVEWLMISLICDSNGFRQLGILNTKKIITKIQLNGKIENGIQKRTTCLKHLY